MTDLTARLQDRETTNVSSGVKRVIDVVGALIALAITSPIFLVLTALVASTGAPVFFLQERVGRNGTRFNCLKFRTMTVNAEAAMATVLSSDGAAASSWHKRQKLQNDPRVTPLGYYLRRWGIDELPQLINVLRGEMSLVGPRPIIAPDRTEYPADLAYANSPAFAAYIKMRPGITGLWQVRGGSNLPYRRRIELDQFYVRRWSLLLDIRIVLMTPLALLRRKSG